MDIVLPPDAPQPGPSRRAPDTDVMPPPYETVTLPRKNKKGKKRPSIMDSPPKTTLPGHHAFYPNRAPLVEQTPFRGHHAFPAPVPLAYPTFPPPPLHQAAHPTPPHHWYAPRQAEAPTRHIRRPSDDPAASAPVRTTLPPAAPPQAVYVPVPADQELSHLHHYASILQTQQQLVASRLNVLQANLTTVGETAAHQVVAPPYAPPRPPAVTPASASYTTHPGPVPAHAAPTPLAPPAPAVAPHGRPRTGQPLWNPYVPATTVDAPALPLLSTATHRQAPKVEDRPHFTGPPTAPAFGSGTATDPPPPQTDGLADPSPDQPLPAQPPTSTSPSVMELERPKTALGYTVSPFSDFADFHVDIGDLGYTPTPDLLFPNLAAAVALSTGRPGTSLGEPYSLPTPVTSDAPTSGPSAAPSASPTTATKTSAPPTPALPASSPTTPPTDQGPDEHSEEYRLTHEVPKSSRPAPPTDEDRPLDLSPRNRPTRRATRERSRVAFQNALLQLQMGQRHSQVLVSVADPDQNVSDLPRPSYQAATITPISDEDDTSEANTSANDPDYTENDPASTTSKPAAKRPRK